MGLNKILKVLINKTIASEDLTKKENTIIDKIKINIIRHNAKKFEQNRRNGRPEPTLKALLKLIGSPYAAAGKKQLIRNDIHIVKKENTNNNITVIAITLELKIPTSFKSSKTNPGNDNTNKNPKNFKSFSFNEKIEVL